MKYRAIGKTGMEASIVGLGAEHLDNKPYQAVESTIHAAIDQGINIMDVFMPGEEIRRNIGKAIAGKRDKILIQGHIGSTDLNQQYDISRDINICKKYFEDLLRFLNTDYIDFGMLFYIDTDEAFDQMFHSEIFTYVQKLKRDGTIRGIGASSHNPEVAARVVETGAIDLLMFSINPAFDRMPPKLSVMDLIEEAFDPKRSEGIEPSRAKLYQLCEKNDVGITVMKTLGAAKLLSKEHTPYGKPLTVGQCIHYVLTRPAVVSALVGCTSVEQVMEAVKYLELSDEEKDYASIISDVKAEFKGDCVYCSHCLPCPVEIDIAAVNKYLDIASLDTSNIPQKIIEDYKELKNHGSDCIACGSCEDRCPFSVPVIQNMERANEIFGN